MKNESMMNRHQSECWISDSAKHLHAGPRCKLVCSPCSWEPEAVGYSGTAEHCHNFALVWDKSDSCDSSSSRWSGHSWPGGTDGGVTTSHSEAFGPVHCPDNKSGLGEGAVTTLGFSSQLMETHWPWNCSLQAKSHCPLPQRHGVRCWENFMYSQSFQSITKPWNLSSQNFLDLHRFHHNICLK